MKLLRDPLFNKKEFIKNNWQEFEDFFLHINTGIHLFIIWGSIKAHDT